MEAEARVHAVQQEKQLQKLQLLLQQVNGELRDATINIQAVSKRCNSPLKFEIDLNHLLCWQEKSSSAIIEQSFTVQREQLIEAQEQLNQQELKIQELSGITKRQETDISLLKTELQRLEYVIFAPKNITIMTPFVFYQSREESLFSKDVPVEQPSTRLWKLEGDSPSRTITSCCSRDT